MGYETCIDAEKNQPINGETGAGIGASVGKICGPARATRTGLGIYAVSLGELKISAVVVLNALGDIFDPSTGKQIAGLRSADGDSLYAVSMGNVPADINVVGTLAAEVMEKAIIDAVDSVDNTPTNL